MSRRFRDLPKFGVKFALRRFTYPFQSYAGHVTFGRQVWGQRTFDLNQDGLANYGLYADWLNSLQQAGGTTVMHDMFQGAESYLEMWERANGVPSTSCLAAGARFSAHGFGRRLRLDETATPGAVLLRTAAHPGAPQLPLLRRRLVVPSRQRRVQPTRWTRADRRPDAAWPPALRRRRVRASSRGPARRTSRGRHLNPAGITPADMIRARQCCRGLREGFDEAADGA